MHPPQIKRLPMVEFIALMALITSMVALSIDAVLPALARIGEDLGASSQQQTFLIISLFFAGMAVGQLFFGPFADVKGRRMATLVGFIIFLIGTFICYTAESMQVLLTGRVIQAFGISGPRIASMAIIRDLYIGEAMARVMSFIMVIFILVPMIAPIIGQVVMYWFGWRYIFVVFSIASIITAIWFFSRQAETLPRIYRKPFNLQRYFHSAWWVLKHPVVMGASIGLGSIFGAFLGYLSSSQTIFVSIYDTGDYFPLIFACLAFSIGAASLANGMLVMRHGMSALITLSLWCTLGFAVVLCGVTLFSTAAVPPLWSFMGLLFIGFFFIGVLFGNLNALAMEPVGHIAGVGASVIGALTSAISTPIGIFIASFVSDDILPIALGFLVFCVVTLASVLFALKHRISVNTFQIPDS